MNTDFAFLEQILNTVSDSILVYDLKGHCLYVNEIAYKSRGYTRSELMKLDLHALDVPEHAGLIESELLQKGECTFESAHSCKDKSIMPVEIHARIIGNEDQQYIVNIVRDITKRKKNETRVKELEEQQQSILDNIQDTVWLKDKDFRFVAVNKAFLSKTMRHIGDILGHSDYDFVPKELKEKRQAIDLLIIRNGQAMAFEECLPEPEGTLIWIETVETPMRNSQGEIVGITGVTREITQRKEMEQKLKDSEERFRLLVEHARDIIFHIRMLPKPHFEYISPSVTAITGYTPEEHKADPDIIFKMTHPEDLPIRQRMLKEHAYDNIPVSFRIIRKDGKTIWVEQLSIPFYDDHGNVIAIEGIVRDISERKRVEEELIKNKKALSLSAKLAKLGPWEYDPQKEVFIFNDEFYAIYGTSVEREGATMTPEQYSREFTYPESALPNDINAHVTQNLPPGENITRTIHRILRRDGEIRFIEVLSKITKDSTGRIIDWYGANQDITESKLAEEAMRASEEKYRSLVQNVRLGIFRAAPDAGGRFQEINETLEKITGFSRNELLNMAVKDLYTDLEDWTRFVDHLDSTPGTASFETYFDKKDGTKIAVSIIANTIKDKTNRAIYIDGILEDITERKTMEERIIGLYQQEKKQRQELEEEAKARGKFIDVLAHELRTPLTPILASTGMLNDLLSNKAGTQGRLAANVYTGARTLVNRLEELLELARYSRGTFSLEIKPVNMGKYLREVTSRFKSLLEQYGQTFTVEISQDLPVIEIDQSRLEQVIGNLLSNAGKFSPPNGHVALRSRIQNNELLVEIQDEGVGITSEERQRIFQPYHRVEQDRLKFPGLGLGLAVAKQIVEAHGGKIWVVSASKKGSIFCFTLPLKHAMMAT